MQGAAEEAGEEGEVDAQRTTRGLPEAALLQTAEEEGREEERQVMDSSAAEAFTAVMVDKVSIKCREYGEFIAISPDMMLNEADQDRISSMFAYSFSSLGWRARIPVQQLLSLERPVDWWQHLRQRWFPKWWLRRYPVRMDTVNLDRLFDVVCDGPEFVLFSLHGTGVDRSRARAYREQAHCAECGGPVVAFLQDGSPVLNPSVRPS